jgi:uncharacterized SAM-binding protein YcdF (DUF218 family)
MIRFWRHDMQFRGFRPSKTNRSNGPSIAMRHASPRPQTAAAISWTRSNWLIRAARFGLIGGAMAVAFLIGGFLRFVTVVTSFDDRIVTKADGIVVLTGGRDRVQWGVDLLESGRARRLLISGVHPSTTSEDIRKATEARPNLFGCCVDIDHKAETTIGNAAETADWVKANGFRSVLLVTSAYHMPRALSEVAAAIPGVVLVPAPVKRSDLEIGSWYHRPMTAKLLLAEYVKYILARLRLTVKGLDPFYPRSVL